MLAKNLGFTLVAVLTLAIGIGANTAIFSVVNTVLLRPLPYAHPERLVRLYSEFPTFPGGGLRRFWISPPEFMDLRREAKSWESLDAWVNFGVNLAGETEPIRATSSYITGGMLPSLGVPPFLGRLITPSDDDPGGPLTIDISYGLWQRAFGGDPGIAGRDTLLNGRKCTIIGVMPKGFQFPPGEVDPPEVWIPLQIDPANPGGRGSHFLYLLGRLKPGVTQAQAQAELKALVQAWGKLDVANSKEHYPSPEKHPLVSYMFQDEVARGVRPALLMLLGAVGLVLLIACVNVAHLLLARSEGRQREVAVRSAIGAGFSRLLRQFVTEGMILSILGAVLGMILSALGLSLVKTGAAISIPRASEIGLDWRVLAFAVSVSILTGVVFGIAPMFHLIVRNLHEALKSVGRATTSSAGAKRFRESLVVVELGLALVLLIGTGLMIRAFWKLQEVDAGFNPQHVITMSVTLPNAGYPDPQKRLNFWTSLQANVSALPGVSAAGLAPGLPPVRQLNANDTQIENFVAAKGGPLQNVDFWQIVNKDYFPAMGIRLIEGRLFDERDGPGAPNVAIVNQSMARMFWGNQSPLGRRVRPGFSDPWCTVIGVVADVKNAGLDQPTGTELFLPFNQPQGLAADVRKFYIILRASGNPSSLIGAVRKDLHDLDPGVPLAEIRTLDDVMSAAQSRPRFLTTLLSLFSIVALILATIGIYGVISYAVAQRTTEFGLRMALGAGQDDVLKLVVVQGFKLTLVGVAIGIGGALALTHFLSSLLYGVKPSDPATFIAVSLVLASVALLASYIPARRATKVDPMVALRYE
jgi:putative ABC transport system permease protein